MVDVGVVVVDVGLDMDETWMLRLLARGRPVRACRVEGGDETTVYRCRARLLTVTTVDAATAVVARAVAATGGDLGAVSEAWAARTPNPITRSRSARAGSELLAHAARDIRELRGRVAPLPRPVAAGVIAAHIGLAAEPLARMVGYDDLQGELSGTQPADAQVWTQALLPDVKALAAQVAHLTDATRIPATGAELQSTFASL